MGHGTPRVGMPPGAATTDAPRARGRPPRILLGGPCVIIVGEPVGAPLVAHAREIREAELVGRRAADRGQPKECRGHPLVTPWESCALEAAARRPFPLGLRRQPR